MWVSISRRTSGASLFAEGVMAVRTHRVAQSQGPGWWQQARRSGGQEPAWLPYWVFVSARCARKVFAVHTGVNDGGANEKVRQMVQHYGVVSICVDDWIEGYEARHPASGTYASKES